MTDRNSPGGNACWLPDRRAFLKTSAAFGAGVSALWGTLASPLTARADDSNLNVLGPRPGYSPQIGVFVSMLTWMREANGVIRATQGLSMADLDHLSDPAANTIGALMLHLAAAETFYQFNTFEGKRIGPTPPSSNGMQR